MGFLQNLGNAFSTGVNAIGDALSTVLGGVGGVVESVGESDILNSSAANTVAAGLTGGGGALGGLAGVLGGSTGMPKTEPSSETQPWYKQSWVMPAAIITGLGILVGIVVAIIKRKKRT